MLYKKQALWLLTKAEFFLFKKSVSLGTKHYAFFTETYENATFWNIKVSEAPVKKVPKCSFLKIIMKNIF